MPLLPAPKPGYASSPRQQPITFRAVAAAGGVSVDFLYRHPSCGPASNGSAATSPAPQDKRHPRPGRLQRGHHLTARLTELRRELAETKAQLAAAHGELLALRRHPGNAAPATDPAARRPRRRHVKDASSTT